MKGPGLEVDKQHFGHFEIFNIYTSCRLLRSGVNSSLLFSFRVKPCDIVISGNKEYK